VASGHRQLRPFFAFGRRGFARRPRPPPFDGLGNRHLDADLGEARPAAHHLGADPQRLGVHPEGEADELGEEEDRDLEVGVEAPVHLGLVEVDVHLAHRADRRQHVRAQAVRGIEEAAEHLEAHAGLIWLRWPPQQSVRSG